MTSSEQSNSGEVIWTCKIGGPGELIGTGHDFPMRRAVEAAYRETVGRECRFDFSGWGAELDECERAVVEDRMPREHDCTRSRDLVILREDQRQPGQDVEDLRAALCWALAYIGQGPDVPADGDGETWEDYSGATRLAWPDNPEQWA